MAEGTDYEKILNELQEDRVNLDRLIAWVKGKLAKTNSDEPVTVEKLLPQRQNEPIRFPRLKPDTFFKMSFQQAIRECLSIMRRPMTAREITDALRSGGLTHKAKDLYQTVFPTLSRMKGKGEVDKLPDGLWGLSEWYERKGAQPQPEEEK
jgi:hypothetical protein